MRSFGSNESGAVTVDWVALVAGILLLGIMVVYAIFNGGVSVLVSNVNSTLESVDANIADGSGSDSSDSGGDTDRTGSASDQACVRTGKFVVCMGPK
jgi:hypothetical protein